MELPPPMRTLPRNAPDTALCHTDFITELMQSAMPTYAMSPRSGDVALCGVTFITELMECDFARTDHFPQHNEAMAADYALPSHVPNAVNLEEGQLNATDDASFVEDMGKEGHVQNTSNSRAHSHRVTEQCHGIDHIDNVNLSTAGTISTHVQNAGDLCIHAPQLLTGLRASDSGGSTTDHNNTGAEGDVATNIQDACNLRTHAQHPYELQGMDDVDLIGSKNQSTHSSHACVDQSTQTWHASSLHAHTSLQNDDIAEFQVHSYPHRSIGLTPCSSDDSASEDSLHRFSHHVGIANKACLAPHDDEDGSRGAEKLTHGADSREKTHMTNLNLLHLLLACAEAVSEDNFELAIVVLVRLQELSSQYGSPLQRLSFYMCNALEARIISSAQDEFRGSLRLPLPPCDMLEAFCVFYNVNPIGRFCHLTLNQLILDYTVSDAHVHIVDLHIGYGMQWAAFLEAIALRPHGPPKVRLTAIGPRKEHMLSTGKKLMDMAMALHIPFEYCMIASDLQSFDVGMIDVRQDEVCVISSLGQFHTLLHKGSEFVDAFLAGLKSLEPKVLVLAENDVNHNDLQFLNRFVECLKYYAAVFESLDAALPPTSQARLKIEELLCGRKIGSIVACEGAERVERHETMQDWMRRLERAGFRNASLTHTAINQAKLLLKIYYPNGYSLIEEHQALTLLWNGAALMAIGVWH